MQTFNYIFVYTCAFPLSFLVVSLDFHNFAVEKKNRDMDTFKYTDERFADIQMLRYKVEGFDELTLKEKIFIYYLQEAALWGRDILFDQNGHYNLRIRKMLEAVYESINSSPIARKDGTQDIPHEEKFRDALATYLKRVWFSSGIHHHYGCEKFSAADIDAEELRAAVNRIPKERLPLKEGETADEMCNELFPVIFDPTVMPMRVNQQMGDDLVKTSACNYYAPDITQDEAEKFYAERKAVNDPRPIMAGMNSRLERDDYGQLWEHPWRIGSMYSPALEKIVDNLGKARPYACNAEQQKVIDLLVECYRTGDLRTFDQYSIHWLKDTESKVDFTNYFTETYGDPLGMKASWEAYVNFKDMVATERTKKLSDNAQWFEDHSPVALQFKKKEVRGVSAKVINAAILAGDLYPSSAIGINLPNSDWVRREYGSKSVTIGNLTDAYNKAARGSGMMEEFVIDDTTRKLIDDYGDTCDDLHTDLHECLGHGSGKLLPTTDPDSLKSYGSTIEEARADLFGLYYMADPKLVSLGLTPNFEAYKSQYYTYMMNGLITQLVRIKPGNNIEEAHMRNRSLITHWALENGKERNTVGMVTRDDKTYVRINDYTELRSLFGRLLAEIQRIKSEGDYDAAKSIVETYGVKVSPTLHKEVLARYESLHLSPYKGFINPVYTAIKDEEGNITNVTIDYSENYDAQMLRYSHNYSPL